MNSLTGQLAVVTGASGGIGRAILDGLLALDCRVIAWDIDVAPLASHPAIASGTLRLQKLDVTDEQALQDAVMQADAVEGGITILVNGAGISGPTIPAVDYTRAQWDRVLLLNLTSVFEVCRRVLPRMAARGYGRVVNISSVVGLRGIADACAYSASKAGVIGLTMGLSKEYLRSGVTLNCIAPALIETGLLQQMTEEYATAARSRIPMGRAGLPEEVAAMVAWMASPACSFTTGAVFDVSGGRLAS